VRMPVDDIVLDDVAAEDAPPPPARFGGRRFWMVAAALLFAGVFVVVEIFANFGLKDTIAHAEHSLDLARTAAGLVRDADGSFGDADAVRLPVVEPSLSWLPGGEPSAGLDQVSVATRGSEWGAAVEARPGACFYLHLVDGGQARFGVGTLCTGEEALQANDSQW
jgi:hypothetical protein